MADLMPLYASHIARSRPDPWKLRAVGPMASYYQLPRVHRWHQMTPYSVGISEMALMNLGSESPCCSHAGGCQVTRTCCGGAVKSISTRALHICRGSYLSR